MYSVLSSRTQISGQSPVFLFNTTLAYYPFEAPFQLTSPPNSAVYVPWVLGCDVFDSFSIGMAAKGKFYYICAVWENRNTGCTSIVTLLSKSFL